MKSNIAQIQTGLNNFHLDNTKILQDIKAGFLLSQKWRRGKSVLLRNGEEIPANLSTGFLSFTIGFPEGL